MSEKINKTKKEARKVLRKSRESKRKILFWVYILAAAVLIVVAAVYIFVLRLPFQPETPEDLVIIESPTVAPTLASPTIAPTSIVTTMPIIMPKPMTIQDSFKELYDENSDIVGWISVQNTDIDYPIVQADDNSFYMDKDFYKEYSYPGSIFADFRCDFNNVFESAHQIVYGHNMKNGTMFEQLTKFQDETFFNENRYININTLYGDYIFEVFAAYETSISFYYLKTDFVSRQSWLDFITVFQEKSAFETDIVLSGDDVVLTLSTCTNSHNDNDRFVVQARLTNPEQYDMVYEYIY